jgi:putative methyltransferase (TIGR04325 family)
VGSKNNTSFEGSYNTWQEADAHCNGYDNMDILEKVLFATLKVKNGEAVYERDSVIFDQIEYSWPVLTGLMWAAAQNSGCLKVLDFGGSLGSSNLGIGCS